MSTKGSVQPDGPPSTRKDYNLAESLLKIPSKGCATSGVAHVPQLAGLEVVDAVGGGDDVRSVDERAAAEVDVVELLFLEDGNLPGVLG